MSDFKTASHTNSRRGAARSRRIRACAGRCAVAVALWAGSAASLQAQDPYEPLSGRTTLVLERPALADAQTLFYNARYEEAAALVLRLRASEAENLAGYELRSSALLFQLKGLLDRRPGDNGDAITACAACPSLIAEFLADIHNGQAMARAALESTPADEQARFFLGKLDLNYVWLQLGPLHRKSGWDEYWEARRSLDAVLKLNPQHGRARVARAWIDYIVDTRMPWGTRWLLGGGNRKQGLKDVRDAASMASDFFTHAEAEFALWNMHVREHDMPHATEVARRLAHDFPDNREVAAFLEAREARTRE